GDPGRRVRAVPGAGGLPAAHAARPRGDPACLHAPRLRGARGAQGAGAIAGAGARASALLKPGGGIMNRSGSPSRAPDRPASGGSRPRPGDARQAASLRLEDLDYALPAELIAQHPPARREDARLLVLDRATGGIADARFAELGRYLGPGDTV